MAQAVDISSPLLYRFFCTCAGFILVSSDYTINLIGLYPVVDRTVCYIKNNFTLPDWRRLSFMVSQLLALSLIS